MNQKEFINIIIIIGVLILVGAGTYFVLNWQTVSKPNPSPTPNPNPTPTPTACTQEAKQCPDGSYVSRTGKNCEFAKCPIIKSLPVTECKKDSDCPSSQYNCEVTQGIGTTCRVGDPSCVPTITVIKGTCKLKEGSQCRTNSDCLAGLLCHTGACTNPVANACSSATDTSCGYGYQCVADCGPPVIYPGYVQTGPWGHCMLNEQASKPRMCPICLAGNTLIDTPSGLVLVKNLQVGMPIWTIDKAGHRVSGIVMKISKVLVPPTHQIVHLVLNDGRELFVSPGHPTIDGRTVGDLMQGDLYNNAHVVSVRRVPYDENATYDVLPSGETGFYWANRILLDSTLH